VLAVPLTSPSTWIEPDDYPASAVAAEHEGATTVALEVDEHGRPSACTVASSSGYAQLDDLTCTLLVERARFTPATDDAGRAVASIFAQRVAWRIPRERLITQGAKITFAVGPDGELAECTIVKYQSLDGDLRCDPEMVDVMAEEFLPSTLDGYRSVSILLAMEVADSAIQVPRVVREDRTVITRAVITVSSAGVVLSCRSEVEQEIGGRVLDLCGGPVEVGAKEFDADPAGLDRTVIVSFEISGALR